MNLDDGITPEAIAKNMRRLVNDLLGPYGTGLTQMLKTTVAQMMRLWLPPMEPNPGEEKSRMPRSSLLDRGSTSSERNKVKSLRSRWICSSG
eukprot:scaffold64143_cov68-Attheya_sp.AAC.4